VRRILVLTHRLPFAPNRGDRIRAYHLVRLLASKHEVRLVSLIHDHEERGQLPSIRQTLGVEATGIRVAPVRNFARAGLALAGRQPLTHLLLSGPDLAEILKREADRRPDVVLAYGTGMMHHALGHGLQRIPCLLDMVDVDSEKWAQLAATSSPPMKWIYQREATTLRDFERLALRHAFATTVVSERERQVAVEALGQSPLVVSNGVDLREFAAPGPPQDSKRVVFCGVFDYPPNADGAIWLASQVWPIVKASEPDALLQLVGMRPSPAVRSLARTGSIEVSGEVPDVRPYLWDAAVAVAPLAVARGVQNKVLEAVAAGLPSVVSPAVFEGLPDAVRPACVASSGPDDFAAAIVSVLRTGPPARRAWAQRASLVDLGWPRQLGPFFDLVEGAAAGRSSPSVAEDRPGGRA
jgi:sugar transferase (PEP-CTERM/EpsH1 system associated)